MAELDLGTHCDFASCHQLDFLPFTCSLCKQVFCLTHNVPSSHMCPFEGKTSDLPQFTGEKSFSCCKDECTKRELQPIICQACDRNFCLAHRHQVDHLCPLLEKKKETMIQTKEHVQKIVESKSGKKSGQGRKSKATAAKVALMKMKLKAKGDTSVLAIDRIYLQIIPPLETSNSQYMYFSKVWSVGRVVDEASILGGIANQNNIASAKKLRMFDADDGHMFPVECKLEELLNEAGGLYSGGNVILEYVLDDVTKLSDLNAYTIK